MNAIRALPVVFLCACLAAAPVLAAPAAPAAATAPADAPEAGWHRAETVFFIAIPFTLLYSTLLTLGAAAIIQKGRINLTVPYRVATGALAITAAAFFAWQDAKHPMQVSPSTP